MRSWGTPTDRPNPTSQQHHCHAAFFFCSKLDIRQSQPAAVTSLTNVITGRRVDSLLPVLLLPGTQHYLTDLEHFAAVLKLFSANFSVDSASFSVDSVSFSVDSASFSTDSASFSADPTSVSRDCVTRRNVSGYSPMLLIRAPLLMRANAIYNHSISETIDFTHSLICF